MPMLEQKALLLLSKTAGELTMGTRPIPKPGPGQVLVKNVAAALNPADCLLKNSGRFVDEFGFPAVLGEDGSGTIVELGEGVKGWKVGDEVMYQSHANPDRGSFQEYSICDAVRLGKKPSSLTFEQAATIPAALGTATVGLYLYHAGPGRRSNGCGLVEPWAEGGRGKYTGKPLLVIGGSGSVGQLTIQLAKLSGFNPIITTASGKNEEYCREAGATHVVDYRNTPYTELAEAVRKITDKPVKYVYDAISTKETQEAGWNVLAPGGTIIVVLPAQVGKLNDVAEDGKRTASMSAWVHVDPHKELAERMYAALPGLIERGEIKPNRVEVIEGGLAGIAAGVDRLEKKSVSGVKLVARIAETP